jgi:hypothetical protein
MQVLWVWLWVEWVTCDRTSIEAVLEDGVVKPANRLLSNNPSPRIGRVVEVHVEPPVRWADFKGDDGATREFCVKHVTVEVKPEYVELARKYEVVL